MRDVNRSLTAQSHVNGAEMNEVFAWLKSQKGTGTGGIGGTTSVKW